MKNVNVAIALSAAFAAMMPFAALSSDGSHVPGYLKSAVVYQISLRTFTRDGNFRAATEMLEHVRSAGVDVVYLTPFVEMDRDMDETGWSPLPNAKPLMAERGELAADGMCRLGAWGYVVVPSNP